MSSGEGDEYESSTDWPSRIPGSYDGRIGATDTNYTPPKKRVQDVDGSMGSVAGLWAEREWDKMLYGAEEPLPCGWRYNDHMWQLVEDDAVAKECRVCGTRRLMYRG